MSKTLTVNNTSFNYPDAGEPKGWGEEATAWAEEVTDVLADLKGPNDILQSSFSIGNNQSTFADVVGLIFDPGQVRSATIQYNIYRVTDTQELSEEGVLRVVYKNNAAVFELTQDSSGDSGVSFQILPTGQVQYSSSLVAGVSYVGTMKFRAQTLEQI